MNPRTPFTFSNNFSVKLFENDGFLNFCFKLSGDSFKKVKNSSKLNIFLIPDKTILSLGY